MKVLKWIDKYFEEILLAILLAAITLIMFFQIIMRFVFSSAQPWPEEVCRYLFVWLSFIGISYSIKCGNSLKVDIIETVFPKLKKPLNFIANIVFLAFCVVIVYIGFGAVAKMLAHPQLSPAASIPMWTVYISFLIGAILSVIRLIQLFITEFVEARKGKKELTEEI